MSVYRNEIPVGFVTDISCGYMMCDSPLTTARFSDCYPPPILQYPTTKEKDSCTDGRSTRYHGFQIIPKSLYPIRRFNLSTDFFNASPALPSLRYNPTETDLLTSQVHFKIGLLVIPSTRACVPPKSTLSPSVPASTTHQCHHA